MALSVASCRLNHYISYSWWCAVCCQKMVLSTIFITVCSVFPKMCWFCWFCHYYAMSLNFIQISGEKWEQTGHVNTEGVHITKLWTWKDLFPHADMTVAKLWDIFSSTLTMYKKYCKIWLVGFNNLTFCMYWNRSNYFVLFTVLCFFSLIKLCTHKNKSITVIKALMCLLNYNLQPSKSREFTVLLFFWWEAVKDAK